jgi:centromere/kinetochore protein ZW10
MPALYHSAFAADITKESWAAQDQVGVSKTCRVMRLLDIRSFELKSAVHEVFDHVWKALVHTDIESRKVVIYDSVNGMMS